VSDATVIIGFVLFIAALVGIVEALKYILGGDD
jgi:hypothetical protein